MVATVSHLNTYIEKPISPTQADKKSKSSLSRIGYAAHHTEEQVAFAWSLARHKSIATTQAYTGFSMV